MYKKEDIVVVKSEKFKLWFGFINKNLEIINLIENNYEIMPRNLAEEDANFKQIIPYMIFKYQNKIFLMHRGSKPGEKRLADKYSIGIGGHTIKEDAFNKPLLAWGLREFSEEISYSGNFKSSILGFINDDHDMVGKTHLGVAILLEGDSENISIKSELKSGILVHLNDLDNYFEKMESWSQFVFSYLKNI